MTILHGHKHIHVSSQMQVAQEQGNDCGGDGDGSVYSNYKYSCRSTVRNYYNGPYTSISKFSCNLMLHIRGPREKLEKVCNVLGINQDREDTEADPHESEDMRTRGGEKRVCV